MATKENLYLIYNAKIYLSGNPDNMWMIFNTKTGYIQDIGQSDPPFRIVKSSNQLDCQGKRVLPGFHESHIHTSSIGRALDILDLENCKSIEELQKRIKEYAEKNPNRKWILGRKWEQDIMGRLPSKEDIDAVLPDRPAMLVRACGHVSVLNSKAFETVGFTKETPDPEGGSLDHYPPNHPKKGELTGIIRETARKEVYKHITMTTEEKKRYIEVGCQKLLENGATSHHPCEGSFWNEYCSLVDEGKLPLRTFMCGIYDGRDDNNFPKPGEQHGDFLSCDRVKLWADGSLGASTAAMSKPYKNSTDKGLLTYKQENLNNYVKEINSNGWRLEIHVIGDAAAEAALDALAYAKVAPEKRSILTHCQILREDLIDRMKQQGCIANIQPQFVTTDSRWCEDLLHEDLMEYAYVWKTLMDKRVVCAGGSDAPVEPAEPMIGIYDAIFRPIGNRNCGHKVFKPEESLTVTQAIDLYTKDGAYTTLREHQLGQLLPGFQADFIILQSDHDVVTHPERFLQAKVEQTWVAGQRKYQL